MNKTLGQFLAFLAVVATFFTLANVVSISEPKYHTRAKPRTVLADISQFDEKTREKINRHQPLDREGKAQINKIELETYRSLRNQGIDEVSFTKQSQQLRDYRLRKKKKRGIFRKKSASLSEILFPGVSPEEYMRGEQVWIYADILESRLAPIPFSVYDLPGYYENAETGRLKKHRLRSNLGSRLLGHDLKPAPFDIQVEKDVPCTVFGKSYIGTKERQWLRQLIERQYRVNLQLDSLPVLLKSRDLNFALHGYPIGFKLPDDKKMYLYNHLKFAITYHEDPAAFEGVHITGFDVHPVSTMHDAMGESCSGYNIDNQNDRTTFVRLEQDFSDTPVLFSYDVKWHLTDVVDWADRWDIYLVHIPDDDIHYYSIVNSLVIVVINTAVLALIMVRALQAGIANGSKEDVDLKAGADETGWKSLRGDVFRPPTFSPMLLSVLVGSGVQIGVTIALTMLLSVVGITNIMKNGQLLTSLLVLYALSGPVAGYSSSRLYKFCNGERNWKTNAVLTAAALPSTCFLLFVFLNILLSKAGAATAVSLSTILALFCLWIGASAPLVFVGVYFGHKMEAVETSSCTNQVARAIPRPKMVGQPVFSIMAGGILPFLSSIMEVAFAMSAMWLHQIYYTTGCLLTAVLIVLTTCALVSMTMCYMQLRAEDHRWWWKSFWNCASAGVYLFLYSLWFLDGRLRLIGELSVAVYLTCMVMISICFGICCGSVGFIASFWFTRTIYGPTKIDLKASTLYSSVLSVRRLCLGTGIPSSDANDYHLLSESDCEDAKLEASRSETDNPAPSADDCDDLLLSKSEVEDSE